MSATTATPHQLHRQLHYRAGASRVGTATVHGGRQHPLSAAGAGSAIALATRSVGRAAWCAARPSQWCDAAPVHRAAPAPWLSVVTALDDAGQGSVLGASFWLIAGRVTSGRRTTSRKLKSHLPATRQRTQLVYNVTEAEWEVWHRGCRCRGSSGSGGSGGSGAGSRLQAMHADDAEALGQPRRPRQAAAVNDGSHNLGHGVRDVADDLPTRQRPNGRDYTPHPLRKQRRGDIVHAHDHLQQQHAEVVQVSGHDGGVALTDTDARRRCGHVQPPLRRSDGVGHKHADIGCAYGGSSNDATAVASIAPYTRVVAAYARTNRDHVTVAGRSRGGINTSS